MEAEIVVDVAGEQVSLDEARRHCNITPEGSPPTHEDDAHLEDIIIPAAREWCEEYTGLSFAQKTYEIKIDEFPEDGDIRLPIGPVLAIESVTYVNEEEAEITLGSTQYTLDKNSVPQWLIRANGVTWPTAKEVANAVTVRFIAGFSLPGDSPVVKALPKQFRIAMLMLITHLYENRGAGMDKALQLVPLGVKSMLDWKRVRRGWA